MWPLGIHARPVPPEIDSQFLLLVNFYKKSQRIQGSKQSFKRITIWLFSRSENRSDEGTHQVVKSLRNWAMEKANSADTKGRFVDRGRGDFAAATAEDADDTSAAVSTSSMDGSIEWAGERYQTLPLSKLNSVSFSACFKPPTFLSWILGHWLCRPTSTTPPRSLLLLGSSSFLSFKFLSRRFSQIVNFLVIITNLAQMKCVQGRNPIFFVVLPFW